MTQRHTSIISTDEPAEITVHTGAGRWFRVLCSIVESGTWARLSGGAKAVYVVLAKHSDARWLSWPSLPTIAKLAGTHPRHAIRAVNELEAEGLLTRRRGGGRLSTLYELRDVAATPSLPFPNPDSVREKSAVTRARLQPSRRRDCSPDTGATGTRHIEQDSLNNSSQRAAGAAGLQLAQLAAFGFSVSAAKSLLEAHGPELVAAALARAKRQGQRLTNPAGWIRRALESGFAQDKPKKTADDELAAMLRFKKLQQEASERALRDVYQTGRPTGRPNA